MATNELLSGCQSKSAERSVREPNLGSLRRQFLSLHAALAVSDALWCRLPMANAPTKQGRLPTYP